MIRSKINTIALLMIVGSAVSLGLTTNTFAASTEDLDRDSQQALHVLYDTHPSAEALSHRAKAILVFPNMVKAGLVFGGSFGEGELIEGSKVDGYYNSISGSWGLQLGAQSYGYVVFLMTDKAVKYVQNTDGWELGVGPTIVAVDEGAAKNLSTSTLKKDAYAFIFNQQGLMASVSIEGTKITRIKQAH